MSLISHLSKLKKKKEEYKIVILGLNSDDRTNILKFIGHEQPKSETLQGLKAQHIQKEGFDLIAVDSNLKLPSALLKNTHLVVYILDASDSSQLNSTFADNFEECMSNKALDGVPVLVLGNNKDKPGCASESQISDSLAMEDVTSGASKVVLCNVSTGDNVQKALEWGVGSV